jgi:hypothetical protein
MPSSCRRRLKINPKIDCKESISIAPIKPIFKNDYAIRLVKLNEVPCYDIRLTVDHINFLIKFNFNTFMLGILNDVLLKAIGYLQIENELGLIINIKVFVICGKVDKPMHIRYVATNSRNFRFGRQFECSEICCWSQHKSNPKSIFK